MAAAHQIFDPEGDLTFILSKKAVKANTASQVSNTQAAQLAK